MMTFSMTKMNAFAQHHNTRKFTKLTKNGLANEFKFVVSPRQIFIQQQKWFWSVSVFLSIAKFRLLKFSFEFEDFVVFSLSENYHLIYISKRRLHVNTEENKLFLHSQLFFFSKMYNDYALAHRTLKYDWLCEEHQTNWKKWALHTTIEPATWKLKFDLDQATENGVISSK